MTSSGEAGSSDAIIRVRAVSTDLVSNCFQLSQIVIVYKDTDIDSQNWLLSNERHFHFFLRLFAVSWHAYSHISCAPTAWNFLRILPSPFLSSKKRADSSRSCSGWCPSQRTQWPTLGNPRTVTVSVSAVELRLDGGRVLRSLLHIRRAFMAALEP